jgi:porphobilinogen synthase
MEINEYFINQRRLRLSRHMRELCATVRLNHKAFIQPLFVEEGLSAPRDVEGLSFVQVDTLSSVIDTIERDLKQGVSKFLIFPVPAHKCESDFDFTFAGSVIKTIRSHFTDRVWLASDLCLCSYTTHGHCGILDEAHQYLRNQPTVIALAQYATVLAASGADCIAPSDMMDGRIASIRKALNANGYEQVSIMSYAAKFSSQFYGPFRDACHSAPKTNGLHDRKTYQIASLNADDALSSALRDDREGADLLMVKPAALYTDVIARLRDYTNKPLAAYHVSGEYAAIELLAKEGLLNRAAGHLEVWTALTRAGANVIISYAARNAKEWIGQMEY